MSSASDIVTAAVLVIGDEILSGRTKDKNIGFIADYICSPTRTEHLQTTRTHLPHSSIFLDRTHHHLLMAFAPALARFHL